MILLCPRYASVLYRASHEDQLIDFMETQTNNLTQDFQ